MPNNLGPLISVIVIVAVVGWFALATQANIRRGNDALRWLQDGLKLLGEKASLRWLGSSVLELKIRPATGPFLEAAVIVVLEPRDVPFLWWYYRALGRRDLLIVRCRLRHAPDFDLEALDPRSWTTQAILKQVRLHDWDPITLPGSSPLVAYATGNSTPITQLLEATASPGCMPVRLGVRRAGPNLEVQWRLAEIRGVPAREVFAAVALIPRCMGDAR